MPRAPPSVGRGVPKILDPITLDSLTIRNRVWLSPMCQYSAGADGVPTDWHRVHLGARAQGGFGLVMTEATAVAPEGRISPNDVGIWNDEQRDAWAPIAAFIRSQGATPAMQLAHAGRKASTYRNFPGEPGGVVPAADGGWPVIGPSDVPFPGLAEPRAMDAAEIARVVDAFAAAARRADEAGFDVVEVHAAHGYLLHEFLSPLSNKRTDGYGGSFEHRIRLVVEVVDAVRAAFPAGKPVIVRVSATDWVDDRRSWTADDTVRLAGVLREHGVSLVDTSTGANVPVPIPVGPGYQVPFAARIHAEAGVPSGAVGIITEPQQAESILVEGQADVVLIGRAALREPSWPQRAAHELGVPRAEIPYPLQYVRGAWR